VEIMNAFVRFKEEQTIKPNKIKDCLKEYFEKYKNSQLVELETKIQSDENTMLSTYLGIVVMILCCIMYIIIISFGFIDYRAGWGKLCGIVSICVSFAMVNIFSRKSTTMKKIKLKNNVIELHSSNNEIKTYKLDQINIKYKISYSKGRYRRNDQYINIYFNDDKYTSRMYGNHRYEPYIAFIILVNLLKRNEIEKINKLDNYDIKILQQDFTYSKNKQY